MPGIDITRIHLDDLFQMAVGGFEFCPEKDLRTLPEGGGFKQVLSRLDERPLKTVIVERSKGRYYCYFSREHINIEEKPDMKKCYTVEELSGIFGNNEIKQYAVSVLSDGGTPRMIGPLTYGQTTELIEAASRINFGAELQALGRDRLTHIFPPKP